MPLSPPDRRHRLVLVVDDDADLAETLTMLLHAEGFRSASVGTAKEAMAFVDSSAPDAVLLDYMLPDMSGGELGSALRSDARHAGIKIAMYTSTPEEVVRAVFDRYDAFLAKPVLHDRLVSALDRVFATASAT